MLMASDNMQFTVQASAMMSMHYIYVRLLVEHLQQKGSVTFSKQLISNFGANDGIGTIFLRFEI